MEFTKTGFYRRLVPRDFGHVAWTSNDIEGQQSFASREVAVPRRLLFDSYNTRGSRTKKIQVLIFESSNYGNVLVLDNVIQCTERDEFA